jgi:exonuclease SbcC
MKSKLAGIKKELELLGDVSDGGDTHAVSQTMAKMQADVKSAKNRHADAQKELGRIEAKLELLTQEYSKKEPLMKQLTLREYVSKAFSKKGVPSLLVREKLPLVNAEISNLLAGIVDFTIDLEADGDTNSLEIYINYGDSRRVIELSSGMERTIASIAIRTVLHGISILPKPDFMVIDEGFGTLDPAGVDSCIRLLRSISSRFRFLIVVSHVEQMKDAVDSCIEISKHEKDSYVNYIGLCRRSRRNDMAILQFTISMLHSVRHSYANTVDTLAMIHTISRSWNHMERAGAVTRLFTKRSRSVLEMIFSAA